MPNTERNTDKRLSNLREPWKPGECGNPKGRPKGKVSLKRLLETKLEEVLPNADGKTIADGIIHAAVSKALKGDKAAMELVFNYIEGRPIQSVDLSGYIGETPIVDDLPKPDAPL